MSAEVKRFVSPYAAGTESYRGLVDTNGRTEPDDDEGPFFVRATDFAVIESHLTIALDALQTIRDGSPLAAETAQRALDRIGEVR